MPQSGFTPIITYNTATASAAPSAGNLTQGELAVNVTDKKIYTKNSGGSVVQVGSGPDATETLTNKTLTSPDINGGTIDGVVIGGSSAAAGSFTTLSASGNATVSGTAKVGTTNDATYMTTVGAVTTLTLGDSNSAGGNVRGLQYDRGTGAFRLFGGTRDTHVNWVTFDNAGSATFNSGTFGYGVGAGGTASQSTSRTTTVAFGSAKATGAITMFTAAGSATPATFTVTNPAVAATDTIILSVKSSTNKYIAVVTAVAASSFDITFWTTGGTASDAPVINFSVIKGVAS